MFYVVIVKLDMKLSITVCVFVCVIFAVSFNISKTCSVVRGKDSNLVCNTEYHVDSNKVSLYEFDG